MGRAWNLEGEQCDIWAGRFLEDLEERDGEKDQDAGGGNLLDYAFGVVYVSWILRMSSN